MLTTNVLAVLAAAGWWWVTWPERTAREFVELFAANRVDDRDRLLSAELKDGFFDWEWERLTPWPKETIEDYLQKHPEMSDQLIREQEECLRNFPSTWREQNLVRRPRTFFDRAFARQVFSLPDYWFTVERGFVVAFGFVWEEEDVDCLAVSW